VRIGFESKIGRGLRKWILMKLEKSWEQEGIVRLARTRAPGFGKYFLMDFA